MLLLLITICHLPLHSTTYAHIYIVYTDIHYLSYITHNPFKELKIMYIRTKCVMLILYLYEFHKADIPEDSELRLAFLEKLMGLGVSLQQYQNATEMEDVTM